MFPSSSISFPRAVTNADPRPSEVSSNAVANISPDPPISVQQAANSTLGSTGTERATSVPLSINSAPNMFPSSSISFPRAVASDTSQPTRAVALPEETTSAQGVTNMFPNSSIGFQHASQSLTSQNATAPSEFVFSIPIRERRPQNAFPDSSNSSSSDLPPSYVEAVASHRPPGYNTIYSQ